MNSIIFGFLQVLLQYMQRCNSLGWLTRFQFEERWMQLLGVINQPIPLEDSSLEQYHAYYLNVCSGTLSIAHLRTMDYYPCMYVRMYNYV